MLYEYYDLSAREKAELDRLEEESDKIDDNRTKQTLDWAEEEERKELELLKQAQSKESVDPMDDPGNKEWVEKQLAEAKEVYGEDFGEDIELDFTE